MTGPLEDTECHAQDSCAFDPTCPNYSNCILVTVEDPEELNYWVGEDE